VGVATTSTEYVHVSVAATGGQTELGPPKMAFLTTDDNPAPGDWHTAEWAATDARIMVGPDGGALTLPPGMYEVWVTWTAGDETPVVRSGRINIY